jgi:predicted transcriptional regulator of viral defense system
MNAKELSKPIEEIHQLLKEQNGFFRTSDLSKRGIPSSYITLLLERGEIKRVSRGLYTSDDIFLDDMLILQTKFKNAIFSHETALFLLGLSDRNPLFFTLTVPSGYNASRLKRNGAKVFFIKQELLNLGLLSINSPFGNPINTFDLERTICDIIRNRNKVDIQIENQALKSYVNHKDRNFNRLFEYATKLRVLKKVKEIIEVLS